MSLLPRHPCFLKTSSKGFFPVGDPHLPAGAWPGLIGLGSRCGEPCILSPYKFGFFSFYQECLYLISNFPSPQRFVFLQAHCATSLICCRIWLLSPGWHISPLKPCSSLWCSSLGSLLPCPQSLGDGNWRDFVTWVWKLFPPVFDMVIMSFAGVLEYDYSF